MGFSVFKKQIQVLIVFPCAPMDGLVHRTLVITF